MPARDGLAFRLRPAGIPEVPGVLTADQMLATGRSVAAMQQPTGAIGWPDGHADAWNHVECAMALTACGLARPARRAYAWLAATQRPDGTWDEPQFTGTGFPGDFYINYHLYRQVFPVSALGRYLDGAR